jgi:hypothetical protein
MTARHPNRAALTAELVESGEVLCSRTVTFSVPQFLHLQYEQPEYQDDLNNIGLNIRGVDPAQLEVNEAVRTAIEAEAFRTFHHLLNGINVRITTLDPSPVVGAEHTTVVTVGGANGDDFGFTSGMLDVGNLHPNQDIKVFTARLSHRNNHITLDPVFRAIFDTTAIFDPSTGNNLNGTPVRPGEFVAGPVDPNAPNAVRLRTVQAAVFAFGRLLGENIAHECGHALGRDHPDGGLMALGGLRSFKQRTGIRGFDPATGEIDAGEPGGLTPDSLTGLTLLIGTVP